MVARRSEFGGDHSDLRKVLNVAHFRFYRRWAGKRMGSSVGGRCWAYLLCRRALRRPAKRSIVWSACMDTLSARKMHSTRTTENARLIFRVIGIVVNAVLHREKAKRTREKWQGGRQRVIFA
jgi:hypothetical protein